MRIQTLTRRALPVAFGILEAVMPQVAARLAGNLFSTPPPPRLSARALAFLSTGRRFHVPFGDVTLAAWAWGREDAERTVVLMHGWGGRASQMAAFVAPLVAADVRVIGLDGPAHGESGGKRSALPHFAAALQALRAHVGRCHGLICHSMGGAAAALAMKAGLDVERAVFIGSPASPFQYADEFARRMGVGPASMAHMKAMFEQRFNLVWHHLSVPFVARGLQVPLLVIQDEDDEDVPMSDACQIADAWAGAELLVTKGYGHRKVLRAPAVVQAASAFVTA